MRITFLGSGGAFTDYRVNYQNNALIETAEGPVLLDCGTTACQSLRELGVHPTALRAVLFTHLHADHASPEQLVWERYYTGPDGASAHRRTRLVAPESLLVPLRRSLEPFVDVYTDPQGALRGGATDALIDFEHRREVEIGGVRFRFFRVPHATGARVDKAAFGLEISDASGAVFWSGDTTLSPGWVAAAAARPDVRRIFHECTFTAPRRGTIHTHWEELSALPAELLSRITLMHHGEVPERVDLSPVRGAATRHQVFDL